MNRIVIITGVSCSGKTSLQNELLQRWWNRPLNFTTRKPRTEEALIELWPLFEWDDFTAPEFDEYVFLSRENFLKKLKNGDFLEHTNYWWEFYGVSRFLWKWNTCIVLDPIGRSQVQEHFVRRWIEIETYYMDINKELQLERLENRWDTEKQIIRRVRDFKWFSPTNKCVRLNWKEDSDILADFIDNNL